MVFKGTYAYFLFSPHYSVSVHKCSSIIMHFAFFLFKLFVIEKLNITLFPSYIFSEDHRGFCVVLYF